MASAQHTCGSKADVFKSGLNDDQIGVQEAMQAEVDKRMNRALDDLKDKYENDARPRLDTSIQQPSGPAYRQKEQRAQLPKAEITPQHQSTPHDDDDAALRAIRAQRLRDIKAAHDEKINNLHKGHGRYDEICQDDFLTDVLKSNRVVCHFYHQDFEHCKVIDHHLAKLALLHIETRFLKINAAKTPFFVAKLHIRVMPTLVCFHDGKAVARLCGFDGLTEGLEAGHECEFSTHALATWLNRAGAIDYDAPASHEDTIVNGMGDYHSTPETAMRSFIAFDDDDLEDD